MMIEYWVEGKIRYKQEWVKDIRKTVQAENSEEALNIFSNEADAAIAEEIQMFQRASGKDPNYDLIGQLVDRGTIVEKYEFKDVNILIQEIAEVLGEADGDFIEKIANQVLSHPVEYTEDNNFRQLQKKETD